MVGITFLFRSWTVGEHRANDPNGARSSGSFGAPEAAHEIRNSKVLQDSCAWQLVASYSSSGTGAGDRIFITLLISVWVSYALPHQVVKPLVNLKEAIDHAAEGNYEIDFDVQGKGEIVELVESLRHLFAVVRQQEQAQMPKE